MTDKELIQALRCESGNCLICDLADVCFTLDAQVANRLEALLEENERLNIELQAMRNAANGYKKMIPQWKPASEPPEEYRDEYREPKCFLVCVENCREPFRALYDGKHWGDGWNVLDVTHWMPLPEPPSTEGVE